MTRVLWMPKGMPSQIMSMLKDFPQWKEVTATIGAGLQVDPNATPKSPEGWGAMAGADPLVLSGSKAQLDAVVELIGAVLTSIPLIAIEARVVEVMESDESAFGAEWFLFNRGDNAGVTNPAAPGTIPAPSSTLLDRSWMGSGVAPLPGANAFFTPDVLMELGTIVDDFQVDLMLSAMKALHKVDVVNAPNVAVLSGHIASILAGQEIPVFQLNLQGNTTIISTSFKNIAVSLDVMPHLIAPGVIRMAVQVRVQNVTGGVSASIGSSTTTNPVIANRTVTTTLEVRDGSTVVLGGLITNNDLDASTKVPVLGDVPILGPLFGSTHGRKQRSNLIFFIKPKVQSRSGNSGETVILPPGDGTPDSGQR
jgi:type II secretory pathway component GspD/PulD (secretin)